MGPKSPRLAEGSLSLYLLDTTVLIGHLRGDAAVTRHLLELLAKGHVLGTSCVNVAEVESGLWPAEQRRARALLDRLRFLETSREGARRAGRYQTTLRKAGRTLHTPDALVAGTARAHGAVLLTDNLADFPLEDLKVVPPPPGLTAEQGASRASGASSLAAHRGRGRGRGRGR